ncbi:hypothetical protein CSUB01_11935 [Colletotrichum sublineola]|uniref:Uncharacterized protein n=1 Tax=Colletotrichum sublineola TaxID=1173701 RepID=A0A066XMG5_COLSU|nr:hypothetical protein CSUB01_11935 [Colletotrichum sublineola]
MHPTNKRESKETGPQPYLNFWNRLAGNKSSELQAQPSDETKADVKVDSPAPKVEPTANKADNFWNRLAGNELRDFRAQQSVKKDGLKEGEP